LFVLYEDNSGIVDHRCFNFLRNFISINRRYLFNAMVQSIVLLNVGTGSLNETSASCGRDFTTSKLEGEVISFKKLGKQQREFRRILGVVIMKSPCQNLIHFVNTCSLKTVRLILAVLFIGRNCHF